MAKAKSTTAKPINRQAVEAQIDILIDMLNTMDGDTDLEPSLAFSTGGYRPEDQPQEGYGFAMNANRGIDLEDEHCGAEPGEDAEPDVDSEHSLGWGTGDSQTGLWSVVTDLEQGVGAVRKKRPASKTGGKVCRGSILL
jgi:hypothetical protein